VTWGGRPAFGLDGTRAVVCCSGWPFGERLAAGLRAEGASVAVLGAAEGGSTDPAAEVYRAEIVRIPGGLRSSESVKSAFDQAVHALGYYDVLIHLAGDCSSVRSCDLCDLQDTEWTAGCDDALKSAILCLQSAHRTMRERGGRVVVVVPTIALTGAARLAGLAAAAEGERVLAKALAREWGQYGISVNCVAVRSEAFVPDWNGRVDLLTLGPPALPREFEPAADVSPLVMFLASNASRSVTGATICVDGGILMAP
jgi:3-oxoacyl-[acyl-carrier protein] reductase